MNRYSRIFHHITTEDVKRKRRENIKVQKIKEELERERLEAIVEPVQHVDWRDDLKELSKIKNQFSYKGQPSLMDSLMHHHLS